MVCTHPYSFISCVSESSVQVKEDDDDDLVDRYELQDQRDRVKSAGVKSKRNQLMSGFGSPVRTSKLRKVSVLDAGASPEAKEEPQQPTAKLSRKKQKMSSKVREDVDFLTLVCLYYLIYESYTYASISSADAKN